MAEPQVPESWTSTIGQLTPIEPSLLSGEDSVEITVSTRADGGEGLPKKTYRTTIGDILSIYAARRDNPNQVTAEQVGTFDKEQILELLERPGEDDVAGNALRLGGKLAEEYLLVVDFQQTLQNVTSDIDDITDTLVLGL
ncbi:hypothetical protein D3C87_957890 [compost metagenome]